MKLSSISIFVPPVSNNASSHFTVSDDNPKITTYQLFSPIQYNPSIQNSEEPIKTTKPFPTTQLDVFVPSSTSFTLANTSQANAMTTSQVSTYSTGFGSGTNADVTGTTAADGKREKKPSKLSKAPQEIAFSAGDKPNTQKQQNAPSPTAPVTLAKPDATESNVGEWALPPKKIEKTKASPVKLANTHPQGQVSKNNSINKA